MLSYAQERGVSLNYQRFDSYTPKSNLSIPWSWITIQYNTKSYKRYSCSYGINFNTSYMFRGYSNTIPYVDPMPKGKSFLGNIGATFTNNLCLYNHNDIVTWYLSNQFNFNYTNIYSTSVDTLNNPYNNFSNNFLLTRIDLGILLKAKISNHLFVQIRPSLLSFFGKNEHVGSGSNFRFNFDCSLKYQF
jgi:hypothetical protein